jgi:hypothetical protein
MLITKQLLKKCIQYLIESGFDNTSKAKGVYVFLNTSNFGTTYLQIIDDEVIFDKKHTISCLSDLMSIVSDKYNLEYEKFPRLNQWLVRVGKDLNTIKDPKDFGRFLEEVSNSLIESKMNGAEETKIKYKIKNKLVDNFS